MSSCILGLAPSQAVEVEGEVAPTTERKGEIAEALGDLRYLLLFVPLQRYEFLLSFFQPSLLFFHLYSQAFDLGYHVTVVPV